MCVSQCETWQFLGDACCAYPYGNLADFRGCVRWGLLLLISSLILSQSGFRKDRKLPGLHTHNPYLLPGSHVRRTGPQTSSPPKCCQVEVWPSCAHPPIFARLGRSANQWIRQACHPPFPARLGPASVAGSSPGFCQVAASTRRSRKLPETTHFQSGWIDK